MGVRFNWFKLVKALRKWYSLARSPVVPFKSYVACAFSKADSCSISLQNNDRDLANNNAALHVHQVVFT